jgi:hypothetical protein
VKFRPVAKGSGPVCVLFLVGSHMDAALRSTLPGWAIVATDESGVGVTRAELDRARALVGTVGAELALVGFSAGCQGVRALLEAGVRPSHVATFDGTHDSIPPSHLGTWRELAAEARAGQAVWVGTCTQMTYVERIPVGQPGRATSTRHVLEQACGVSLPPGTEVHEGGLHLVSYPSADVDKAAHIAQQREVMPALLARHFALDAIPDTDPAPRPGASWLGSVLAGGRSAAAHAVDALAGLLSRDGAAPILELPPHGWRCSVAELVADARALGTWRPAGSGYVPRVGDLCVSARAGGDPTTGGTGHVERVVVEHHRYPETVGGNEGDTWRRATDLDLLGPSYRGAIEYPHALGLRAVEVTLAEAAAGIRERPGPLAHPRIQAYHAGARRGGGPRAGMPGHEREGASVLGATASDEIAWCASGASSCCHEAAG